MEHEIYLTFVEIKEQIRKIDEKLEYVYATSIKPKTSTEKKDVMLEAAK